MRSPGRFCNDIWVAAHSFMRTMKSPMSLPELTLNILIINEHPDEIKLISSGLREFFSGCRIEACYSSEEALTFGQRNEWHIILIDQNLRPENGLSILGPLRRHAPNAAIILQTDHSDSQTAVQALQSGADFLLFKNSPGFLTELLFYVQEALEKHDLQMKLDRTFQRHLRVIETLSDILYELDREGRFAYISPGAVALLGYTPEELAGRHYSILLPPLQEGAGRFRLNERRAGSRSVRKLELMLQRKTLRDLSTAAVTVEVTAKGLYDNADRYSGTIGVLRDLSQQREQQDRLAQLESRLRETDRQLALAREAARVSRQLQQPLATLLQDSQRLLNTIQQSKIEQHVETMVAKASQASRLSRRLVQTIHAQPVGMELLALNEILQTVVRSIRHEPKATELLLTSRFAADLPMILGRPDSIEDLARILFAYVRRQASDTTTPLHLVLQTESLTLPDNVAKPGDNTFGSGITLTYTTFTIQDITEDTVSASYRWPDDHRSAEDFLRAHRIVQAHGGSIEIESPIGKGLTVRVRIPAQTDLTASPADRENSESSAPTDLTAGTDVLQAGLSNIVARPHDRRRFTRRLLSLPVELSIGNTPFRGVLRNISDEGALLTVQDLSSPIHLQPAYVAIKTPISFLELHGVVHERLAASAETAFPTVRDLVIIFTILAERDRNVLHSLFDGLQDGSATVTFEALILPSFTTAESNSADAISSGEMSNDRRETVRLAVALPVRLSGLEQKMDRPVDLIMNLSRDGACIEPSDHSEFLAVHQIIRLIPVGPTAHPAGTAPTEESEQPWVGRVVRTSPHRIGMPPRLMPKGEERFRVGVRFEYLSLAQELRLQSVIAPEMFTSQDLAEPIADAPIVTVSHRLRNREGQGIVLCHDSPRQAEATNLPVVLLSPGYGMTQGAYVAFAYFLAGSGLRVLRYDHSHHIGLSDGDPSQTTFTSLEDDLDTVLTYTRKEWPGAPLTLLAPDLLGRIALRRQDWHRMIRRLILINPTLDLRHCLTTLHQRDMLQDHLTGIRFGTGNLLGLPLNIDRFLSDAVAAHYVTVSTLHEDLAHCRTDVVFLTNGMDTPESPIPSAPSALLQDTVNLLGTRGSRVSLPSLLLIAGDVAPKILRASWQRLRQLCCPPDTLPSPPPAVLPTASRAIAVRSRFERDQLRAKYPVGATRERLWTIQTGLTSALDELPAYWQYIDHLYQLSQPLDERCTLLDVGCGLHSFSRLLLLNLSYRLRAQTWHHGRTIRYVGTDFSVPTLRAAQAAMNEAANQMDSLFSGRISAPTPAAQSWVLGRSTEALPFADRSFDRIVANLSLSFAASPLHTLRELVRVLRPGGKLILSAFTPTADLALLYRPHLRERGIDEFTGDVRLTLNYMAQICQALRVGRLHAFEEDTFIARLSQITPVPAKLMRALSGQILLAVAEKLDSSG
ncbi:MAG: hypothetical protein OJF47_001381 [Nitrospira sp.]|nr:MAG: hypothetical protein OJF47_001381 [Nitrospira sp.]